MRLPPDQFWQLSLAEWRLISQQPNDTALSRQAFEQLQTLYPDKDR